MPTYEYNCATCDRNFDVVQSFSDEPLDTCPTCGSPVRKVFGNVGIVFKGSGFYKTDNRTSGSSQGSARSATDAAGPPSPSTSNDSAAPASSAAASPAPAAPSAPAASSATSA
ncbi:MAG: FmdB family transcriptional regulator [Actinomycetota bacterium]|nr:FmdB family transcriptional regulator [Actinomycetota bacterium]